MRQVKITFLINQKHDDQLFCIAYAIKFQSSTRSVSSNDKRANKNTKVGNKANGVGKRFKFPREYPPIVMITLRFYEISDIIWKLSTFKAGLL